MAPCIRPFLSVSRTTLSDPVTGNRYPFNGLFASIDIPAGSFLGFYNGTIKDGEYKGNNRYVFSMSSAYVVPPSIKGRVDAYMYPLAMVNEAPANGFANACIIEFTSAKGVIPSLSPKTEISAIGYFTCFDVEAGEELFINYGKTYNRSHYSNPDGVSSSSLVGKGCHVLKNKRETPLQMMENFGLHPFVDKECYVELE